LKVSQVFDRIPGRSVRSLTVTTSEGEASNSHLKWHIIIYLIEIICMPQKMTNSTIPFASITPLKTTTARIAALG
jgi:hypothetical protein